MGGYSTFPTLIVRVFTTLPEVAVSFTLMTCDPNDRSQCWVGEGNSQARTERLKPLPQ